MTVAGVLAQDHASVVEALGDLGDRVTTVLDRQRLLGATSPLWAVVPDVVGRSCRWWLLADDAEAEREGREVASAFFAPHTVGPGSGAIRAAMQAGDAAAAARRIALNPGGDLAAFVQALELMTSVRASAASLRRDVPDPIGYLVRDFYLSLDQHDPKLSEGLLARIESSGVVGSENLRFLRVERLGRLGYWDELTRLPWFAELARARRPLRVTEHLLEAIWRSNFDEAAIAADAGTAAAQFEVGAVDSFAPVLAAVDVPATAAGRRIAVLFAHRAGDAERVDRILAMAPDPERAFLDLLRGRGAVEPREEVRNDLDRARDLFEDGAYDAVVTIAETDPTPALVALAVRSAFELNDPRLAGRAVTLATGVERNALPAALGFGRMLTAVERLAENVCDSWTNWLARVATDQRWPDATEVARELHSSWSRFESADASSGAAEALLLAAEGVNAREVRASLDLLCSLARRSTTAPSAEPFVDAVLLVLAADENPSLAVRGAFFDLVLAVIDGGPTGQRYADVVATAQALWQRVRSRDTVGWLLDMLDLLASSATPDTGARGAFVAAAAQSLREFADTMLPEERQLFQSVAAECGVSAVLPPPAAAAELSRKDVWARLTGKTVGLYSLLEDVGDRLEARLGGLVQGVRVEHNTDTVATESLRALAATADYLLVDTRHASHAATRAIDAARPRERQLYPSGGGLSSFVARLREALDAEGDAG